jgi:hypothetical protein
MSSRTYIFNSWGACDDVCNVLFLSRNHSVRAPALAEQGREPAKTTRSQKTFGRPNRPGGKDRYEDFLVTST